MDDSLLTLAVGATIAVGVAVLLRRIGWGISIPLIAVGALVGELPIGPTAPPDPEFVLVVILAPLVFGEALGSSYLDLRRVSRPVLALAIGLVIGLVFCGGTSMDQQYVSFIVEEVLEGRIGFYPTYGNTLMGLAASVPLEPADNFSISYYAPQPRAVLRVVDPNQTDNTVDYDAWGRVELTTLTKEFFMPRFLERDEAPCAGRVFQDVFGRRVAPNLKDVATGLHDVVVASDRATHVERHTFSDELTCAVCSLRVARLAGARHHNTRPYLGCGVQHAERAVDVGVRHFPGVVLSLGGVLGACEMEDDIGIEDAHLPQHKRPIAHVESGNIRSNDARSDACLFDLIS
jgi:hypothetical protein